MAETSLKRPLEESLEQQEQQNQDDLIEKEDNKKIKLDNEINSVEIKKQEVEQEDELMREIKYKDEDINGGGDDDEEEDENQNENKLKNKGGGPIRPDKLSKEELIVLQKNKITTDETKKKKVAVLLGYSGTKYCGMQKNPGLPTIEEALELAMFKAGGISVDNYYCQQKIDWMRCARTDKGVSAIRNIVSLKLEYGPPEISVMMDAINNYLPEDIKIFAVKRVNNSFHAKNSVDQRSYTYVTPVSVFSPIFSEKKAKSELTSWRFTSETKEFINKILENYIGTHKFHNYTSKKEPVDPSCKRRILSFTCSDSFTLEGIEMVELQIVGDSFMLHQIRKMIGCVIQFLRRGILEDSESKEKALEDIKQYIIATLSYKTMCLPMAPGAGLLLDKCFFGNWEKKFASVHGDLNFTEQTPIINEFKQKIFKEIAIKERDIKEFTNWTHEYLDAYPLNYVKLKELYLNPVPIPDRKIPPKPRAGVRVKNLKIKKHSNNHNPNTPLNSNDNYHKDETNNNNNNKTTTTTTTTATTNNE